MNAICYRWDAMKRAYVVETVTEQPDGTATARAHSKHDSQWDAAAAVLKLRQERANNTHEANNV